MYHAKKYRKTMPFFRCCVVNRTRKTVSVFFIFLLSKMPCLWQLHGSLWRLAWAG